jgi:general stress protein YciG
MGENRQDAPENKGEKQLDETRQEIASKGGFARAQSLDSQRRSEIARAGGLARAEELPIAEYPGEIIIAGRNIACAVLNTRKRVLTQQTFLTALGRSDRPKGGTGTRRLVGGATGLPPFLSAANLEPFISDELRQTTTPIMWRYKEGGGRGIGYDALLLPMVCEVYLKARDAHLIAIEERGSKAGILQHMQFDLVKACDLLMRGLARVGIVALVDAATGFNEQQTRDELTKILEAYIAAELMPWTKKFPDEFFRQIFKLHGWKYQPGSTRGPRYVGKFINEYVYEQLPPGVLDELRRLNPVMQTGYRRHKLTQFLSVDTGNDHLDKQITAVTTIMRIADDKDEFKTMFKKAYQSKEDGERKPLVIDVSKVKPSKQADLFSHLDDSPTE